MNIQATQSSGRQQSKLSGYLDSNQGLLAPKASVLNQAELHPVGAPLPRGAFDGKISQRGLTLPTSTIVPFPTYYGQSRNNAPTQWGLGRYVGAQFARPAHGENTRIACDPVLFTIKTMPCFGTTRNYDAAAGGQLLNFSTARTVNPCHRCTIKNTSELSIF